MIAVARAKLASCSIGHAQVRLGDIADLDAGAGRADVIVIHQVLHYFDDPGRVLAQARRALKPGGEMLIVDFAPHGLEFLRAAPRASPARAQRGADGRLGARRRSPVSELKSFPPTNPTEGLTVCLWRLTDETDNPI